MIALTFILSNVSRIASLHDADSFDEGWSVHTIHSTTIGAQNSRKIANIVLLYLIIMFEIRHQIVFGEYTSLVWRLW